MVVLVGGKAKEDKYKKLISQMGGKVIEDLDEDFEVYVTDDKLIRNSKLLLSIAKGAHVVNIKWLEDSQKRGAMLMDKIQEYLIIDKKFEDQYACKLALLYKDSHKTGVLLKDKKVFVSANIQGIQKSQMNQLIEAMGGIVHPDDFKSSDLCILDVDKDKKTITSIRQMKKDQPKMQQIHFVFNSILSQKLNYEEFPI